MMYELGLNSALYRSQPGRGPWDGSGVRVFVGESDDLISVLQQDHQLQ